MDGKEYQARCNTAGEEGEAFVKRNFGIVEDDWHEVKAVSRGAHAIVIKAQQLFNSEAKFYWLCRYDTGVYDYTFTKGGPKTPKGKKERRRLRSIKAAFRNGYEKCERNTGFRKTEVELRPVQVLVLHGCDLVDVVHELGLTIKTINRTTQPNHQHRRYAYFHIPWAKIEATCSIYDNGKEYQRLKHPSIDPEWLVPDAEHDEVDLTDDLDEEVAEFEDDIPF